jgi:hypothetical protein
MTPVKKEMHMPQKQSDEAQRLKELEDARRQAYLDRKELQAKMKKA